MAFRHFLSIGAIMNFVSALFTAATALASGHTFAAPCFSQPNPPFAAPQATNKLLGSFANIFEKVSAGDAINKRGGLTALCHAPGTSHRLYFVHPNPDIRAKDIAESLTRSIEMDFASVNNTVRAYANGLWAATPFRSMTYTFEVKTEGTGKTGLAVVNLLNGPDGMFAFTTVIPWGRPRTVQTETSAALDFGKSVQIAEAMVGTAFSIPPILPMSDIPCYQHPSMMFFAPRGMNFDEAVREQALSFTHWNLGKSPWSEYTWGSVCTSYSKGQNWLGARTVHTEMVMVDAPITEKEAAKNNLATKERGWFVQQKIANGDVLVSYVYVSDTSFRATGIYYKRLSGGSFLSTLVGASELLESRTVIVPALIKHAAIYGVQATTLSPR